jgi:hypothetical protein
MGRLTAVLLPLALLIPACALELGDAPFYCCAKCNPQCPDGYECKANYCVKEGECPETVPGCKSGGNCGNNACDNGETCATCAADCGKCNNVCGNNSCEPGEDCNSCLQDCGPCGACNNNGKCEAGENPTNCPADCGGAVCNNNGKCEAGENPTNCPKDCPGGGCTNNATQCLDKDNLKYCENSAWKQGTCDSLCKQGGFAYTVGCEKDPSTSKDICSCGNYGKFGEMCDDKVKCDTAAGMFCGTFDQAKVGFCSKNCITAGSKCIGAPLGSTAECVLDMGGGKFACGFICDLFTTCPTGMTCDSVNQLCKPVQP